MGIPRKATVAETEDIRVALQRVGEFEWDRLADLIPQDIVIREGYVSDGPGFIGKLAWIVHGEPCFNTILGKQSNKDWCVVGRSDERSTAGEDKSSCVKCEEFQDWARKLIDEIDEYVATCNLTNRLDAADAIGRFKLIKAKLSEALPPKKLFNVHVRLADQYEAWDEGHALVMMLDALEQRDGLEIMGHDIIAEEPDEPDT